MTLSTRKSIIIICTFTLTLIFTTCTIAQAVTTASPTTAAAGGSTVEGSIQTNVTEEKKPEKPKLTGIPQIDYKLDPNLPRELKGYDLSDYPFYHRVPNVEFNFSCEDRHDGFYASIPHKCQVYHQCLFSVRYDFLCANFTAFDQANFICHFANEVDCKNSELYYFRNDALYEEATTTTTTTPAPQIKIVYVDRPVAKGNSGGKRRPTPKPASDDYYYYEDEKPIAGNKNKDKNVDDYYYDDVAEVSSTTTTAATTTRRARPTRPVRTRTNFGIRPSTNEKVSNRQRPKAQNEASQLPDYDFVDEVAGVSSPLKTKSNLQSTNNRKGPLRRRRKKKTTTTTTTTPIPEYYEDEYYDYYEDEAQSQTTTTTTTTKAPQRRRQGQGGRTSAGARKSTQERQQLAKDETRVEFEKRILANEETFLAREEQLTAQEKSLTAQEKRLTAQEERKASAGTRKSTQERQQLAKDDIPVEKGILVNEETVLTREQQLQAQEKRLNDQEKRLTAQEERKALLQARKSQVEKPIESSHRRKSAPKPDEVTGSLVEDVPKVLEDAPLSPATDYDYEVVNAEELVDEPVPSPTQTNSRGRRPGNFKRPRVRQTREVPREL